MNENRHLVFGDYKISQLEMTVGKIIPPLHYRFNKREFSQHSLRDRNTIRSIQRLAPKRYTVNFFAKPTIGFCKEQ